MKTAQVAAGVPAGVPTQAVGGAVRERSCGLRPAGLPLTTLPSDAELAQLSLRLGAAAQALDESAAFPFDNLALLHARQLIGAVVPARAGGLGASLAQTRKIIGAVARGEPSTALILAMTYLVHRALAQPHSRWPAQWRDAVWHSACAHGALANRLRVEPALGSPARGGLPATIASRTPDGWRLNGHKLYSTGMVALRWLAVWARTDEADPRVGFFLVPRDPDHPSPSIRIAATWDHLGLRASGSHEVTFHDLALPDDNAVDLRAPEEWARESDADQSAWMATLLGAIYDSVARAARDWLVDFLGQRRPSGLGAALATVPRIQETVGEIEALLYANASSLHDLASRTDEGMVATPAESGLVKFNVTSNAIRAVQLAVELSGNHGLSRHNPLERHWRDVQCARIHTPAADSALMAAGQAALGLREDLCKTDARKRMMQDAGSNAR